MLRGLMALQSDSSSKKVRCSRLITDEAAQCFQYTTRESGALQMEGEYTGMLELYNTVLHMIPKP